jgi:hypothetical protein
LAATSAALARWYSATRAAIGSIISAMVPMKACSTSSDSCRVAITKGPTPWCVV